MGGGGLSILYPINVWPRHPGISVLNIPYPINFRQNILYPVTFSLRRPVTCSPTRLAKGVTFYNGERIALDMKQSVSSLFALSAQLVL